MELLKYHHICQKDLKNIFVVFHLGDLNLKEFLKLYLNYILHFYQFLLLFFLFNALVVIYTNIPDRGLFLVESITLPSILNNLVVVVDFFYRRRRNL